ncbi:MAG TPA: HyaD/HybD family hydrogenase maturation endopeptidase [Anaerolineales bacterium]|nr:HyaD/HybD family hydrogenase maturation endopeptidase [Anaerolineae bacterium]HIQ01984.1 HyaD/HybD family hydrogenase maturation endopeptidase [Anaerolineales bacterium]
MGKTLILGVGNILLSDDGVGVHVVRRLEEVAEFPETVQVLDGGTKGLDLLHYLEGVSHLIIIDAVEIGESPGTLARLEGDQVPAYLSLKMSPHEIGLPDMLFAAKLRDLYPEEVVVWGVQPATTEVGLALSEPVAARVDVLVERVLEELAGWGIPVVRIYPPG